jgi:hypothetical protein
MREIAARHETGRGLVQRNGLLQLEESRSRHGGARRYPCFLMQSFAVPAVVVHCHCAIDADVVNGFGRVNLTERKAAIQASVRIAMMSTISWRLHNDHVTALLLVPWPETRRRTFDRYVIDITRRLIFPIKPGLGSEL